MINIFGTIHESVKISQLENKWKQKKEKINSNCFGLDQNQQIFLEKYKEDLENIRENNIMSKISTKIKTGKDLSYDEIEYLKNNNPQLLKDYEQTKRETEAFERDLKKCRTKEEVERLKLTTFGTFFATVSDVTSNSHIKKNDKLAILENILAKVTKFNEAHLKFVNSPKYKDLPTDKEKLLIEKAKYDNNIEKKLTTQEKVELSDEMLTNNILNKDNIDSTASKDDFDNTKQDNLDNDITLKFENPFNNYTNPNAQLATPKKTISYIVDYLKSERTTGSGLEYFISNKRKNFFN